MSYPLQRTAAQKPLTIIWTPETDIFEGTEGITPVAINASGAVLGQSRKTAYLKSGAGRWERLGTDEGYMPTAMNDIGDVVGYVYKDTYDQAWVRRANGETALLTAIADHGSRAIAINNSGIIVGNASADECSHAVVWVPRR